MKETKERKIVFFLIKKVKKDQDSLHQTMGQNVKTDMNSYLVRRNGHYFNRNVNNNVP